MEIIERKGIGHPDTIADNLGEELAEQLQIEYQVQYGTIQHYNVDKVLVASGKIDYRKRVMTQPVNIVFAGQYTKLSNIKTILNRTVKEVLKDEIKNGLKYKIHNMLTEGSPDLSNNFYHKKCNDTSFGVGNPYTKNEKLVLNIGKFIDNLHLTYPRVGTDNKVMFINGRIIIALAFRCSNYDQYVKLKLFVKSMISKKFKTAVEINNADTSESYFNTVTGTSLEQGDAGMTGRGNRYNGLITPLRMMTLEAYYGKNDITHIGRIYQKKAQELANRKKKSVLMVNSIGGDINKPIIIYK